MGLDISYYSNVIKTEIQDDRMLDEDYEFYTSNHYEYQLGSLNNNTYYMKTDDSEKGHFVAGSYSGYNEWRNNLAIMAGYESSENVWKDCTNMNMRFLKLNKINNKEIIFKPFYELINFSDCEGTFGPEISKKLYKDFVNFDDVAKEYSKDNHYFYKKYCEWKEAFRVASENGAVDFH